MHTVKNGKKTTYKKGVANKSIKPTKSTKPTISSLYDPKRDVHKKDKTNFNITVSQHVMDKTAFYNFEFPKGMEYVGYTLIKLVKGDWNRLDEPIEMEVVEMTPFKIGDVAEVSFGEDDAVKVSEATQRLYALAELDMWDEEVNNTYRVALFHSHHSMVDTGFSGTDFADLLEKCHMCRDKAFYMSIVSNYQGVWFGYLGYTSTKYMHLLNSEEKVECGYSHTAYKLNFKHEWRYTTEMDKLAASIIKEYDERPVVYYPTYNYTPYTQVGKGGTGTTNKPNTQKKGRMFGEAQHPVTKPVSVITMFDTDKILGKCAFFAATLILFYKSGSSDYAKYLQEIHVAITDGTANEFSYYNLLLDANTMYTSDAKALYPHSIEEATFQEWIDATLCADLFNCVDFYRVFQEELFNKKYEKVTSGVEQEAINSLVAGAMHIYRFNSLPITYGVLSVCDALFFDTGVVDSLLVGQFYDLVIPKMFETK